MNVRRRGGAEGDGIPKSLSNHCFVLQSLKHRHEVTRLRSLYRDQFILIGVYSPRTARVTALAERLAHSVGGTSDEFRCRAEELIVQDEQEAGTPLGQSVRSTFPLSDAFVTSDHLESDIERLLMLLFGAPYLTPTKDEQGMFMAQSAALRSAAMARQVGACITSDHGDVLAVGCNEVPKARGGQYWTGDQPDGRDYALGHDRNDRLKERMMREVVVELSKSLWLRDEIRNSDIENLVQGPTQRSSAALGNPSRQPDRVWTGRACRNGCPDDTRTTTGGRRGSNPVLHNVPLS